MGFLSSLGKVAAGGLATLSGATKTSVPATGFYNLPKPIQKSLTSLVTTANKNVANPSIYAPSALTGNQTQAYDMSQPLDAEGISALVSMYGNPYDESVINEINKQAVGQNSILKQNATETGTFGSNRQLLGANDIDMSRLNQINTFKQGQFNTSLNTGLQQRQQSILNLLTTGGLLQDQNTATKQAPLKAQAGLQSALATYLTGNNGSGNPASTVSSGGGLNGFLNTLTQGASLVSALSGNPAGLLSLSAPTLAAGAAPGITWQNEMYGPLR